MDGDSTVALGIGGTLAGGRYLALRVEAWLLDRVAASVERNRARAARVEAARTTWPAERVEA